MNTSKACKGVLVSVLNAEDNGDIGRIANERKEDFYNSHIAAGAESRNWDRR